MSASSENCDTVERSPLRFPRFIARRGDNIEVDPAPTKVFVVGLGKSGEPKVKQIQKPKMVVDKEPKIKPDGPPLLEGLILDLVIKKSKDNIYPTSQEIAVHIFGLRGRASVINPTIYRLAKRGLLVKRKNEDGSARPRWAVVENISHIGFLIDLRGRILRQFKERENMTTTKAELFDGLGDATIPQEVFEEAFQQIVLHGRVAEHKEPDSEPKYTLLPPKRRDVPQAIINDIQILLDRNVQGLTLSQLLVLLDPEPEDGVDIAKLGRILHMMLRRKIVTKHHSPGRKYPIWKINSSDE